MLVPGVVFLFPLPLSAARHPSVVCRVLPPSAFCVLPVLHPFVQDIAFGVLHPFVLDIVFGVLHLGPVAIFHVVFARVPRVLLHVALFSVPRSDWSGKVSGLSGDAADTVLSEEANFVHLDIPDLELGHVDLVLDACLLVRGDELVLALLAACFGVQYYVLVVAAVLADDSVLVLVVDDVVDRGPGAQAQTVALEDVVDRGPGAQAQTVALEAWACSSFFFLK